MASSGGTPYESAYKNEDDLQCPPGTLRHMLEWLEAFNGTNDNTHMIRDEMTVEYKRLGIEDKSQEIKELIEKARKLRETLVNMNGQKSNVSFNNADKYTKYIYTKLFMDLIHPLESQLGEFKEKCNKWNGKDLKTHKEWKEWLENMGFEINKLNENIKCDSLAASINDLCTVLNKFKPGIEEYSWQMYQKPSTLFFATIWIAFVVYALLANAFLQGYLRNHDYVLPGAMPESEASVLLPPTATLLSPLDKVTP